MAKPYTDDNSSGGLPLTPTLPLPQSPGSQTRNSFHSRIVCLAPLAYSIVVCRSPERAACEEEDEALELAAAVRARFVGGIVAMFGVATKEHPQDATSAASSRGYKTMQFF